MPIERKPPAEIAITPALVTALLDAQFPELAHLEPIQSAEGWDNALFRLGDDLAVRLPRRKSAAVLIEQEQRWLPQLAARLRPLAVPVPLRVGAPSSLFPWPWSIVPWLPGQSLLDASLRETDDIATVLDRLLPALHQPAPIDAPRNPWRSVPLSARTDALHQHLRQLDGLVEPHPILAFWDQVLATPAWPGPPVWLHGDLHPGNLLIHEGRLSGLIDFGDLTSGDPATDFSLLWMMSASIRDRVTRWPGADPAALRMRARGWAVEFGLAYLAYSHDDAKFAALGRRTIEAALHEA